MNARLAALVLLGCGARTPTSEQAPIDAAPELAVADEAGLAVRCFGSERTCRCERTREPGPPGTCGPSIVGGAAHCCKTKGSGICRCQLDALPCVREAQACRCGGAFPRAGSEVSTCTPPPGGGCCRVARLGICDCSLAMSCSGGTVVPSCEAVDAMLQCTADEDAVSNCD